MPAGIKYRRVAMVPIHSRSALRRTWGKRTRYTIVEDGDRKGNTSGLGIDAKARMRIHAATLPPRTPSLMPLDYSIWHEILQKIASGGPKGVESRHAFLSRLEIAAKSLPKGYISSVIGRMKSNLKALVDARGYTPKNA